MGPLAVGPQCCMLNSKNGHVACHLPVHVQSSLSGALMSHVRFKEYPMLHHYFFDEPYVACRFQEKAMSPCSFHESGAIISGPPVPIQVSWESPDNWPLKEGKGGHLEG